MYIVRWNYDAINLAELTVRIGDEVVIIEPGSKFKVAIIYYIEVYIIIVLASKDCYILTILVSSLIILKS